jgi:two-component system response regulator HydG
MAYDWPGNVRELEHCIERAIILAEGDQLDWESFAHLVPSPQRAQRRGSHLAPSDDLATLPTLEKVELDYILEVLQATRWNRKRASEILGISTVTLWRKVQSDRQEG